ncbi:MAG: DUF393 domain-containing protein [Flavobacteriales bacterium]|nr:DUF393 domain-containing protein [Flavobacteriales bacterium]
MDAPGTSHTPIVFFDGLCGLCNGFVNRLIRWDRKQVLRYATLQGTTAAAQLPPDKTHDLSTIVYFDGTRTWTRSSAALRILMRLGGAWRLTGIFLIVPGFIRNAVYDLVARNRYQWFGKHDSCRIPSPEERRLFLP